MLLLYCMTQSGSPAPAPGLPALGGAELLSTEAHGVRCFYRRWQSATAADALQAQALAFHEVIQAIFHNAGALPFRFPTMVAGESELHALVEQCGQEYAKELRRLHDAVQMKVTIASSDPTPAGAPATSGTEYLQQRRRASAPVTAAVAAIQQAGHGLIREHKQSHRGDSVVLFLLIARDQVDRFREAFSRLSPASVRVTLSGPWPPAEFANCYPDLSQAGGK